MNLRDTVTIVTAGAPSQDEGGNAVPGWAAATRVTVPGSVQWAGSAEDTGGRDTALSRWNVYLPPGTVVDRLSRLEWAGLTLEVDGEVGRLGTPEHHVELRARRVTGV